MSFAITKHQVRATGKCQGCKVRGLSVCAALDDDELASLEQIAYPASFDLRQPLFNEGDSAEAVFNITSGLVRLYRLKKDGRRQIVGFALPGDFLGLAVHSGYDFTAEAIEPVVACRFDRKSHQALVSEKPHLFQKLHQYATHELTLAHDQIVLLGRCTAQERIAAFILQMRERWAALNDGHSSVTVRLPMGRQDIADYLGLTIETVSRAFTQLAREKELTIVPEGIRIADVSRMERLAAL